MSGGRSASRLTLALPVVPSAEWRGGYNYLLNLTRSLSRFASSRVVVKVFMGLDASAEDMEGFTALGLDVEKSAVFSRAGWSARQLRAMVLGRDLQALALFSASSVDVVFECARFFGWRQPFPSIAWFPDFQHRLLPDMFPAAARLRRDLGFRLQVSAGRQLLVSSEDAREDCERFFPVARGRVHVLRFPALIEPGDLGVSAQDVRARYALPDRFFYLPNQLWRHKNHTLVIDALGTLQRQGCPVDVVLTGVMHDSRCASHADEINARVRDSGIARRWHVLGSVPRRDVVALMRSCEAVINPSRCEGWSSSVQEALAFDTPLLLSDIAVHREQAGAHARYFAVDDGETLASYLRELSEPGATGARAREPVIDIDAALAAFAYGFCRIVEAAAAKRM